MLANTSWRSHEGDRRVALVRPLLEVPREETQAYCDAHGLGPRYDSSNLEERFARNRIRRDLIPRLAKYNPSIREALVRLARTAGRDLAYIDEQIRRAWPTVVAAEPGGLRIGREALLGLHPSLRAHLLRRAWEELVGETAALSYAQVEAMMELAGAGQDVEVAREGEGEGPVRAAGKSLSLGRGLRFHSGYQELILETSPPLGQSVPLGMTSLPFPGEAYVGGWHATARLLDAPVRVDATDPYKACLDRTALGDQVQVRPRRRGDRFQPLGMEGTKRLKEFMIDARIPRKWRDLIPLLVGE
jgi:tRNA(Ile)-lysidine synthase